MVRLLTLVVGLNGTGKAGDQPGEALPDVEILSMIREEMHRLYQKKVVVVSNLSKQ